MLTEFRKLPAPGEEDLAGLLAGGVGGSGGAGGTGGAGLAALPEP